MVKLIQHDLEFILKQIKVAEAHSAAIEGVSGTDSVSQIGDELRELVDNPLLPSGLRTVDGSYNNIVPGREMWGASGQPFPQLTNPNWVSEGDDQMPPGYVPGDNNDYGDNGDVVDADPRLISNLIVDQTLANPAAIAAALRFAGYSDAEIVQGVQEIRTAYAAMPDYEAALSAATAEVEAADGAYQQALQDAADVTDPSEIPGHIAIIQQAMAALQEAQQALENIEEQGDFLPGTLARWGIELDGNSIRIPNLAPDEGLSAPYNSWFTLFGQFFDHGLDLVAKGGNGVVYIPLQPDDPLYNPASPHTNFMVLTRASIGDGAANVTTPWVDQNQTYTSHASHQVFLREYAFDASGKPVTTGELLDSPSGGLATWADIKAQAKAMLGIELTDADVGMVPLLRTDPYGNFIPDPATGFAQVIVGIGADGIPNTADDLVVSGTPSNPVSLDNAIRIPNAFLDDIAHSAATVNSRGQALIADQDNAVGIATVDNPNYDASYVPTQGDPNGYLLKNLSKVVANPGFNAEEPPSATNPQFLNPNRFYDDELLDAHYITGDGRGNENIGLTAVHFVFHAEHNRQIEQIKQTVEASGDADFIAEWKLPDGSWNGERLFQAARFATEMQYQHLVFEEFARKVQPDVDLFMVQPDVEINPAIFAEFANVVYRFGHSMLNETVDRTFQDGTRGNIDLFDAFLNPLQFGGIQRDSDGNPILDQNGQQIVLTQAQAAGAIALGMSAQQGNEIDEFVTHVLRNQLIGIPLDLAALNIARGRDTGMPTLNQARAQFQEMADGDTLLRPYTSWADFAVNLKNPESIINFIAAYGTHASITDKVPSEANPLVLREKTLAEKRDAAMELVFGVDVNGDGAVPGDRMAFLNGTGIYAHRLGGLDDVDLWVGGLAEKKMAFGGMLGSTFSFIFQLQMENLQDSDRFYYLSRTQGLNFLTELENNSLAKMVMRNTDIGENGLALPADIFSTPDHILYMDLARQMAITGLDDPQHSNPFLQAVSSLVQRIDANNDGVAEYIRYNGLDHIVIQGTDGHDHIVSGGGDDTVWGGKGNDRIEAGYGVDSISGGEGDDIITSAGTDIGAVTVLKGESGNDVIVDGTGMSLIFGGDGKDYLVSGFDDGEIRGGQGDDFIYGGDGMGMLFANEGNDWVEGGSGFDYIAGDNGELFFNSTILGHDVLNGGAGDTDYDGDSGDDIMFGGEGIQKNIGMWGHDWVIHQGQAQNVDADMRVDIFTNLPQEVLRDRFSQVEGLSGWNGNDILRGDDRQGNGAEGGGVTDPTPETGFRYNELNQAAIDRIDGLGDIIRPEMMQQGQYWADGSWENGQTGTTEAIFVGGNIMLGGGGSDIIEGRGGDDVIDGDRYLKVGIRIVADKDDPDSAIIATVSSMQDSVTIGNVTKSLTSWMVDGTINPGQLHIVREIADGGQDGDTDVAVYWDVRENYEITRNADGSVTVEHVDQTGGAVDPATGRNRESDGTDRLYNIEVLRFADGDLNLNGPQLFLQRPGGTYRDDFDSRSHNNSDGTAAWTTSWVESGDTGNNPIVTGQIQIDTGTGQNSNNGNGTNQLRFLEGNGAQIQRGVDLAGATSATLSYLVGENGLDNGEWVRVLFSRDGSEAGFVEVDLIDGSVHQSNSNNQPNVERNIDLTQFGTGPFTANAAIRFVVSDINSGNEDVRIDNLQISFAGEPVVNYATTYTEDQSDQDIASNPLIVPSLGGEADEIVSARIVLTNAMAGDGFDIPGNLPGDIDSTVDTSVAGQIIVNLTGTGTIAQWQEALTNVEFRNTSQDPDETPRVIQVTVSNESGASNVATTTITVVAVDDPAVLSGDTVITNIASGNIVIPEWVLLANDIDVDDVLDITGVSNPSSVGSLSLTTNPGAVTLVDSGAAGGSFSYAANGASASVSVQRGGGNVSVFDNFGSTSYGRNDGTVDWASNWSESNDSGNQGGAGGGDILVSGGRLVFDTGIDGGESIQRSVDLSGVTSATLTFNYEDDNLNDDESVIVQARNVVTNQWETLQGGVLGSTTSNGAGTFTATLTGNHLGANSAIRFLATGDGNNWDDGDHFYIDDVRISFAAPVTGGSGSQVLIGDGSGSTFDAGTGDDIILAGGGDDTIHWYANGSGSTDGRDFIDGGAGTDTFRVFTRSGTAETFGVYTVDAALNGPNAISGLTAANLKPGTEIIITRTTGGAPTVASIIAELDNIEEIRIGNQTTDPVGGSAGSGDSVAIYGNFDATSLALNTITIEGTDGDDNIDITQLDSAHRIVFRSNGGNDTIVGALRTRDVIELPDGKTILDYEVSIGDDGLTRLTGEDGRTISFYAPDGMPGFGPHEDDVEDDSSEPDLDDEDDVDDDDLVEDDDDVASAVVSGTAGDDVLTGSRHGDTIIALGGHDSVLAGGGDDVIRGGAGDDYLNGEGGRDMLFGGEGNDDLLGGAGDDMLYGDAGHDRIFGGEGNDLIDAGTGEDTAVGGAGNDRFIAAIGDGNDTYYGDDMSGYLAGVDTLDMAAITAGITVDLGTGFQGRGSASSSQSGHDVLWGIENVVTGSGNDTIIASGAVNVMDGGAGSDTYRFLSAADANGDTIASFQPGDRIDLSAINAGSSDGAFKLVTGTGFNAAGALKVEHQTLNGEDFTLVQGNLNGGTDAEFTIKVKGHHNLTATDFVL
jgi:Ca2+-binding RTX toxin-like protein